MSGATAAASATPIREMLLTFQALRTSRRALWTALRTLEDRGVLLRRIGRARRRRATALRRPFDSKAGRGGRPSGGDHRGVRVLPQRARSDARRPTRGCRIGMTAMADSSSTPCSCVFVRARPRLRLHRLQALRLMRRVRSAWRRSGSPLRRLPRPPRGPSRRVRRALQHDPDQRHRLLPRRRRLGAICATEVIPPTARAGRRGPIRIWSAGCASGEEAYTWRSPGRGARATSVPASG